MIDLHTSSIVFSTMPPKIIPNKYEKLTYYILDNYNADLRCEGCNTVWTQDGTAFMRDQAGSRDNLYYRHFRCKGKGKGKCSQSYSHEDFLTLAIRQLGTQCIERVKIESGYSAIMTTDSGETPVLKRSHDGVPSGFTPTHKRTLALHVRGTIPPPNFLQPPIASRMSSDFPDDRGNSLVPFLHIYH